MIRAFITLAVVLGIAFAFSYWSNDTLAAQFLALAFTVISLIHVFHLNLLKAWAALLDKRELPRSFGLWEDTFAKLRRAHNHDVGIRTDGEQRLNRIQSVVNYLPDSLIVLDRYDHIIWYNNAARELHEIFGLQRPVHHFIRQPEFVEYFHSKREQPVQLRLPTKPGRLFEVRVIGSKETSAEENAQQLVITRDITDAAKIDVMRRDFVANVSHEIRTPVTVIGGFAETLLTLDLDEASQKQYLETILKQSQTMQRLLTDLLTLSSLENSEGAAEFTPINMYALLEGLALEAKSLSNGKHTIALNLDGPQQILGAQTEVESAARNLITNSLRYTPEGGKVDVIWQGHTGSKTQAWLRVSDSGIGIAHEHIPRLTERFYRVDRGRSRDTGGTGLGLAIVKHVAQRHGAQFEIESELGKGSRFSIGFEANRLSA